jgi:hypothetical protein
MEIFSEMSSISELASIKGIINENVKKKGGTYENVDV